MKDMDRKAIEVYGMDELLLMENAGLAVYDVIKKELCGVRGLKFAVFCGPGNNGGDGLVVARKIHSNGGKVKVLLLQPPVDFRGIAKKNLDMIERRGMEISVITSVDEIMHTIDECDAIIDAILGTGITKELSGLFKEVIEAINRSGKPIFSVDIPSGINGNNGLVMGVAVRANFTITFGLPKIGNVIHPGYEYSGKLYVSHISFPPALYENDSLTVEINIPDQIPPRKQDAHKGTFGEVLFIAGARGYLGAPYFSALSFLKAGGGYSRLAAPASVSSFIATKGSEIVMIPQKETPSGSIAFDNKDSLLELANKMDMVVMGPGLSLNEETQELVRYLAENIEKPLLIDGDGITAISKNLNCIKRRDKTTIITPHPGEMSRITGVGVQEIRKDRIGLVERTAKELNAIVVLKEGISFIGRPDGKVFINMSGNSGMSTAGSGDVLNGSIAAMYGQGMPIEEAVKAGVFIHGLAGDLAADAIGQDGMTAQDILNFMPSAVRYYRTHYDRISRTLYGKITVI